MIESLSMAVHAFESRVLMSFSIDETLLPRQVIYIYIPKFKQPEKGYIVSRFYLSNKFFSLF